MNAVEIDATVSELAGIAFNAVEFPFAFLEAFGNKETTLKRLRKGDSNGSDLPGGVLQRNNIHIAVAEAGKVGEQLKALRESPKTGRRRRSSSSLPTGRRSKLKSSPPATPLPATTRISRVTLVSSFPSRGSLLSKRSKTIRSTSGRQGDSISFISNCSRTIRTGRRRRADAT